MNRAAGTRSRRLWTVISGDTAPAIVAGVTSNWSGRVRHLLLNRRRGRRARPLPPPPPDPEPVPAVAPARTVSLVLALFHRFPTPIIVTEEDGCIRAVNPAAAALLGDAAGLLGTPISDHLPDLAGVPAAGDGAVRACATSRAGTPVDLDVRSLVMERAAGPLVVHVLHDVTPHTELSRLREQLLHNVAHELNSPITALETALGLLRSASSSAAERAALLDSARRTAGRLRALTGDLLTAGTIQSGRLQVQPCAVSARSLIEDAVDAVDLLLGEREQRVALAVAPELPPACADAAHIARVLANLLTNAAKYSTRGATLRVAVDQEQAQLRFSVEDDGPGISSEEQKRLFSRYYRPRPRDQTPGIGLGLAIAKGVVEAHGGCIGIDSRPGQGTRVWFTLPAVDGSHQSSV